MLTEIFLDAREVLLRSCRARRESCAASFGTSACFSLFQERKGMEGSLFIVRRSCHPHFKVRKSMPQCLVSNPAASLSVSSGFGAMPVRDITPSPLAELSLSLGTVSSSTGCFILLLLLRFHACPAATALTAARLRTFSHAAAAVVCARLACCFRPYNPPGVYR